MNTNDNPLKSSNSQNSESNFCRPWAPSLLSDPDKERVALKRFRRQRNHPALVQIQKKDETQYPQSRSKRSIKPSFRAREAASNKFNWTENDDGEENKKEDTDDDYEPEEEELKQEESNPSKKLRVDNDEVKSKEYGENGPSLDIYCGLSPNDLLSQIFTSSGYQNTVLSQFQTKTSDVSHQKVIDSEEEKAEDFIDGTLIDQVLIESDPLDSAFHQNQAESYKIASDILSDPNSMELTMVNQEASLTSIAEIHVGDELTMSQISPSNLHLTRTEKWIQNQEIASMTECPHSESPVGITEVTWNSPTFKEQVQNDEEQETSETTKKQKLPDFEERKPVPFLEVVTNILFPSASTLSTANASSSLEPLDSHVVIGKSKKRTNAVAKKGLVCDADLNCGFKTSDDEILREHKQWHSCSDQNALKCTKCSFRIFTAAAMERHLAVHMLFPSDNASFEALRKQSENPRAQKATKSTFALMERIRLELKDPFNNIHRGEEQASVFQNIRGEELVPCKTVVFGYDQPGSPEGKQTRSRRTDAKRKFFP